MLLRCMLFDTPQPQAKALVNETIVLMPFYGVAVGTGHSVVSTRFAYLNLTFWSHYRVSSSSCSSGGGSGSMHPFVPIAPSLFRSASPHGVVVGASLVTALLLLRWLCSLLLKVFPHIGVVVGTQEDYDFVTSPKCGLPWAEVINVLGHISMPKNMGVALGIAAQQRFRSGAWARFKYMYFTESDQVAPHALPRSLLCSTGRRKRVGSFRFTPPARPPAPAPHPRARGSRSW